MDIDNMIKEITAEVMKSLREEDAAPAARRSFCDAPAGKAGYTSAYDLGPCAEQMRRETAGRNQAGARETNYSSRFSSSDFDFPGRRSGRTGSSAYDYQTRP